MRVGTKGGASIAWFGLKEALRAFVREPQTSLSFMTRTSNAAAYRLFAATAGRMYPSRRSEAPPEVCALVSRLAPQCGYHVDPANPWFAKTVTGTREPERLARSASLRDDPDAKFYTDFTREMRHDQTLVIWIPLDLINIAASLSRLAARVVKRFLSRR